MQAIPSLIRSDLAPGLWIGEAVEIGEDVSLGCNVVIYGGCRLDRGATVQDNAVLGKLPHLGRMSTARRAAAAAATVLGPRAAVLTGSVVFAGATLEAGAIAGDQTSIRERTLIGVDSVIGRGSAVDNDVRIGERVRIQTNCYITAYTEIEDDVFVGPGVITTNDDTMARHPLEDPRKGPTLRRACRVGGGAVLCPGIEIGEEAFVAAGAVVVEDVGPRDVVMGVPARRVREVPEQDLVEAWR